MANEDLNKVHEGEIYDMPDPDNYKDICTRVRKLEQICSQNMNQWNAPTLIRGRVYNGSTTETSHLYIQAGVETISYSEFSGATCERLVTFPEPFDDIPLVFHTHKETNLSTQEVRTFLHNTNTNQVYIQITASGAPVSGTITTVWFAIGKKVQS